ncbi:uncharacterized protein LOC128860061 [Anastrepha ludens]|uniref:uncharacterized protein LOC128860061 n=1 Tax=Anastrepha ludens TaxID=28586 RepID=UPI0023AF8AA3|nr:uncharacterized protein LOC128860061 [Anastrepha ludens]
MGFRYQDLKDRGESIELERKESFTTERSHNGYIKRRKTLLRERFSHPHAKEVRKQQKQQSQRSAVLTTHRPATESGRNTTETFDNSPGSTALLNTCRDKSHLERAVNRTSVHLKRLAHEIDNEITKLKRERDKLMSRTRPHPLMRNAAIQNDFRVDEATTKLSLEQFNKLSNNIEFTIEKLSSQHKFVCTSPRCARDEQTSCRPRMRTIGLQKNTQRSSANCDNLKHLKAKLDTALHCSATNLEATLKAKGLLETAPPNCYAFDYGGTGDGQNSLKLYHLQNCRCAGGCNQNDCSCKKVCEHYNSSGNYNGMLCNKNTYVEKGFTPCSEYKYCRDEYRYDYPKQNNCMVPVMNAPCTPCVPCQPYPPCQPCIPYLPPCPTYNESRSSKGKAQVIYGRQLSDLNTDEFYHPTGPSRTKRSPTKHGSARLSNTKERLTVDVPKDGRTQVDIERHDRARSKSPRKREGDEKTKQRNYYQTAKGAPPDKAKRQVRERNKSQRKSESSGSVDSAEGARHTQSKEKLLEITFTKERRRKHSSESGDDCVQYELQTPDREYSRETRHSMKQMTITAYKPCKPDENETGRWKKKNHKSKDQGDDDKTWDERLRQAKDPRDVDDWNAGIPTITEVYDDYRVGDAWTAEEDNVVGQPATSQYVGGYRQLLDASPRRSYDIMPVQKNTVRDIPPSHSPRPGQRSRPAEWQNVDERGRGSRGADSRDITGNGFGRDGQHRTGSEYSHSRQSDSFRAYGLEEKPGRDGSYSPIKKGATGYDEESRRAYTPSDKSRPDATASPNGKPRSRRAAPNRDQDSNVMATPDTKYTSDGKLYGARESDPSPIRIPLAAHTSDGQQKDFIKAKPQGEYGAEKMYSEQKRLERDDSVSEEKRRIDKSGKLDTGHIVSPGTASEVPEIKIEDLNESDRSARSAKDESPLANLPERDKFAIKGEMVLEPQQALELKYKDGDKLRQTEDQTGPSGKVSGAADKSRKPETHDATERDGRGPESIKPTDRTERSERLSRPDTLGESYVSGRMGEATDPDRYQLLSPFPSLESPAIYMRPRTTNPDYATACRPPSVDCPRNASPRVNCIENAGDVYMCQPRLCNTPNGSPPSSPCRCVSPKRSGSEVPYAKLGDQYTHSPVRQLAATSHLAIALQPDAATGNYIPCPSPRISKNCIYLRSTGTQYSDTNIGGQEDRCAPQYAPLPKQCRKSEETAKSLCMAPCSSVRGSPRQDLHSNCDSESPRSNYKFLCDEENEEYDGKVNFSNDQWCEMMEITNSEKTRTIIAQQQQREQQQKQCSQSTGYKKFFLPRRYEKKVVPGQPLSDCNNMSPWADGLQNPPPKSLQQQPRYPNIMDRRTPRFNATMPPHQEMPEEEARCAQEMPQYPQYMPQPHVKFLEQNLRQYENCDPSCYARAEETNFQNQDRSAMLEQTPRDRSCFDAYREYENTRIPEFTGCPCMFKTYLNMVTLYYPEYRIRICDSDTAIEDDEFTNY